MTPPDHHSVTPSCIPGRAPRSGRWRCRGRRARSTRSAGAPRRADPQPKAGRVGIARPRPRVQCFLTEPALRARGRDGAYEKVLAPCARGQASPSGCCRPTRERRKTRTAGSDQRGTARAWSSSCARRVLPAASRSGDHWPSGSADPGSGPVTAWGMAGSPGLVSGAAEARNGVHPARRRAASPKAARHRRPSRPRKPPPPGRPSSRYRPPLW